MMSCVFGPVPSRRLGLSLGVDLIPLKTCTFDCLYCQVGRTTNKTMEVKPFVPVKGVFAEIEKKLVKCAPDAITLAGSGEPTLHSELDRIIGLIKEMTETRVALLTNGSLFWREEVRRSALGADVILPTLSSAFEDTFRRIHRPHPELDLRMIIDGLKMLRQDYKGQLLLEIVLLAGINDTEREVEGLKTLLDQISPEKIQLNTVVRPPSDHGAISLDKKRLEEIMVFFGKRAEIIAEGPVLEGRVKGDSLASGLLEMIKRKPLRTVDISNGLSLPVEEVEDLVKGLLIKGHIRKQEHLGNIYYLSDEKNIH